MKDLWIKELRLSVGGKKLKLSISRPIAPIAAAPPPPGTPPWPRRGYRPPRRSGCATVASPTDPGLVDPFRRAAPYVDRILRGEKPGDLPVQFPTKFEMVVNRKTATALGLVIPPSIMLRADEVVE